jgi:cob(I)alamin adenosyltransferase
LKRFHGGDDGYTYIMHGVRLAKEDDLVELMGSVDELNSLIGVARSFRPPGDVDPILRRIQETLFRFGSDVATPIDRLSSPRLGDQDLVWVEEAARELWERLPEPRLVFVYPGGDPVASFLHLSRTVCRRAERVASRLYHGGRIPKSHLVFLNRLSDLLFILARYVNHARGVKEELWP